jgi:hypothetical protein
MNRLQTTLAARTRPARRQRRPFLIEDVPADHRPVAPRAITEKYGSMRRICASDIQINHGRASLGTTESTDHDLRSNSTSPDPIRHREYDSSVDMVLSIYSLA